MAPGSPPVRARKRAFKKHGKRGPYKTKQPKHPKTRAAAAWLDQYPYFRRNAFQIGYQIMHPLYDHYTEYMYNTGLYPQYASHRCPNFRKDLRKSATRNARRDSGIVQPKRRENVSVRLLCAYSCNDLKNL